jgi:hypothetical protein
MRTFLRNEEQMRTKIRKLILMVSINLASPNQN